MLNKCFFNEKKKNRSKRTGFQHQYMNKSMQHQRIKDTKILLIKYMSRFFAV